METTGTSRDTRRRRIVERGSDRLALISGRINTLPSEPESSEIGSENPRGHVHTASCPPSMLQTQLSGVNAPSESQDAIRNDDNTPVKTMPRRSLVEPYMRKSEISSEAYSIATTINNDSKGQSSKVIPPTIQTPHKSTHGSEPFSFRQIKTVTYTQISAAFTATEVVRLHCTLTIAISVVLSYIGFPILGNRFLGNVILFRPLCLLLLTNITIALAHLLEKQQRGGLKKPKHHETSNEPSVKGLTDHIGSALEVGLMLQNITGALIMDSSVYAIIVICGLSLAQTLGF